MEDEIVTLRKRLLDEGLDGGAHTISFHLIRGHGTSPSVATIWRVLSRRGFVTPQPHKRPRSSFVRLEADHPNERWQADITHWKLAGRAEVEILNVIDDHSRFLVASEARAVFKAVDVVATFHGAAAAHGLPASLLTDNGAVFTAASRQGRCAMESELQVLGISYGTRRRIPAERHDGPPELLALLEIEVLLLAKPPEPCKGLHPFSLL
jgi:transposase InsO family protein